MRLGHIFYGILLSILQLGNSWKVGRWISLYESKLITTREFGSFRSTTSSDYGDSAKERNLELELPDIQRAYDGDLISKYYSKRFVIVWERLIQIGSPILGWWILRKFDNFTSPFRSAAENEKRLNLRAADLKDSLVQGKSVTFIKSGQALALRPDIVKSPEYIRELQKLQDEVGTFDNNVAMEIITEELGIPAQDLYIFDPPVPIASASIGQVYKAKLRSNNMSVAVKVQRPDAVEYAALDMYILRSIAAYIKKQRKLRSDLVGIVDEFGKQLFYELNYVQEAKNCNRFKSLYGDIPGIYVPEAYLTYTSRRVLTMEFVEGVKGPWKTGGEKMLTVGLQCSVQQLLDTGFFHSDPHRGNLLQTPNGELAYLDFGMMAEVPVNKRFGLIGSVLGLVNKDIDMVITNMKELEFFPPETDTNVVVNALTNALLNSTEGGSASSLNFTRLNQNLEAISDKLPVRLPPFYTLIIRSLTILEGLAVFVDPSFRLIRGAYPFIARQILTNPSPEMNQLLQSLIVTSEGRIRWEKLEQFISISANADAAVEGNFQALKEAQSRSDLMNAYSPGSAARRALSAVDTEDSVSPEATVQIIDYLLSENGRFLREPLLNEIVETVDSLGITAASVISVLSNRIIPSPAEVPDRERIRQFLQIVDIVTSTAEDRVKRLSSLPYASADSRERERDREGEVEVEQLVRIGRNILRYMGDANNRIGGPQQQDFGKRLQILLGSTKAALLLRQVVARLVEKNTRRVVRQVLSPKNVEGSFPLINAVLDLLPKL